MTNFDSSSSAFSFERRIKITPEYKNKLNNYAIAYARERDAEIEKKKKEGTMTPEELKVWLPPTPNLEAAWIMAADMFYQRNGHWRYFDHDLGEEGMDFTILIGMLLRKYNPDKGKTFISFLDDRIGYRIKDYYRELENDKNNLLKNGITTEIRIDNTDTDDGSTIFEIPSAPLIPFSDNSVVGIFGDFSKILTEHGWILRGIRGHKKKREYFRVFYTRDFVMLICPDFSYAIHMIEAEVDRILDQPYIRYIRTPTEEENEKREVKKPPCILMMEKIHADACYVRVTATQLCRLYHADKLYKERYIADITFNTYFGKTNLNKALNEYRELLKGFFIESK